MDVRPANVVKLQKFPFSFQGQEDMGYGTNFSGGCPTLPRHPRGGHHHFEGSITEQSHTMEWPSYQGAGGSRRQHIVATQTPSPHHGSGGGPSCSATSRLSSFRPIVTQVSLSYELPPPPPPIHHLPGLDEEATDNAEVPLMSSADKIESTVWSQQDDKCGILLLEPPAGRESPPSHSLRPAKMRFPENRIWISVPPNCSHPFYP